MVSVQFLINFAYILRTLFMWKFFGSQFFPAFSDHFQLTIENKTVTIESDFSRDPKEDPVKVIVLHWKQTIIFPFR